LPEALGAGALLCALISELLMEPALLGAAALEAALFCALTSPALLEVPGAGALLCALISELLMEPALLGAAALWSEAVAPAAAPLVVPPWLADADGAEQLSAILLTLDTVIVSPAFELALVLAALLLCELAAEAPPSIEPAICTCWPTWLCSMLLSPRNS
jgi:hypothetical protein